MSDPVRILIVEDSPADAELAEHELRKSGMDFVSRRVETREQCERALSEFDPQAVLSDFTLPAFDALAALKIVRATRPSLPFILFSGSIGEEFAIEIMRAGATDYVLKHRLSRLGPTLERALQEANEHARRCSAEKALQESARKFEALFESSPDGIVLVDASGEIRLSNFRVSELFGYDRADLIGTHLEDLMPDRLRKALLGHWEHHASQLTRSSMSDNRDLIGLRNNGTEFPLEINLSPLIEDDTHLTIVVIRDVTEKRRAEEELRVSTDQLRQAQKMEAIGRLAGGVARDFNNILMVIMGHIDLIAMQLGADSPLSEDAEGIKDAAKRAAALTRQLLAFSRKQVLQPMVLNLNDIVTNLEKMLRRLIGEDIHLETHRDPQLDYIRADAGQMEQVIMNLAVNARDAMPGGGSLTIRTENIDLPEGFTCVYGDTEPGSYVRLAVSDTGCGMDPEIMAHIFEPFFTTKGLEKGTGLGLSTVFGIVNQSGGHIQVRSTPEQGTTFEIYLPKIGETASAPAKLAGSKSLSPGSETILLVEDDPLVRRIAKVLLQRGGYDVIEAADEADAVRICQEHTGSIHLLLTDICMPSCSGWELADHLAANRPGMKTLYMSGYTDDSVVRHRVTDTGAPFLQKPFTAEDLLDKVKEALECSPGMKQAGRVSDALTPHLR